MLSPKGCADPSLCPSPDTPVLANPLHALCFTPLAAGRAVEARCHRGYVSSWRQQNCPKGRKQGPWLEKLEEQNSAHQFHVLGVTLGVWTGSLVCEARRSNLGKISKVQPQNQQGQASSRNQNDLFSRRSLGGVINLLPPGGFCYQQDTLNKGVLSLIAHLCIKALTPCTGPPRLSSPPPQAASLPHVSWLPPEAPSQTG